MMSPFCASLNYIRIGLNFFCMVMNILGNLGYLGEEMFIMKRNGKREIGSNVDQDVIRA